MRAIVASLVIFSAATCCAALPDGYEDARCSVVWGSNVSEFYWGSLPAWSGYPADGFRADMTVSMTFVIFFDGYWQFGYGDPSSGGALWTQALGGGTLSEGMNPFVQGDFLGHGIFLGRGTVPYEWDNFRTQDEVAVETLTEIGHVALIMLGVISGSCTLWTIFYALTRRNIL